MIFNYYNNELFIYLFFFFFFFFFFLFRILIYLLVENIFINLK